MQDDGNEQPKPAAETEPKDEKKQDTKHDGKNGAGAPDEDAGEVELAEDSELKLSDEDEDEDEEEGEDGEDEPKPKPKSRSQRYRDKINRLERENAELRQTRRTPRVPDDDDKDLVPPKEADFGTDYMAFDRAMRQYENRKTYRDERRREREQDIEDRRIAEHAERVRGYNARLEKVKHRIRDFDRTMRDAGAMPLRDDIRDGILDSARGPELAYYLAKNPDVLDDLHAMGELAASRKLGNLEARLRLPPKKSVTKAKPPPEPLRGGASPVDSDPGKMTNEQYRKWREAQK